MFQFWEIMDQFQKVDLSGTDVSTIDPQLFASLAKIEKVYNGAVFESHRKGRPAFTLNQHCCVVLRLKQYLYNLTELPHY